MRQWTYELRPLHIAMGQARAKPCLDGLEVVLACTEALLLAVDLELAGPAFILGGTVVRNVLDTSAA